MPGDMTTLRNDDGGIDRYRVDRIRQLEAENAALRKIASAIDAGIILQCTACGYAWEYNHDLRDKARDAVARWSS